MMLTTASIAIWSWLLVPQSVFGLAVRGGLGPNSNLTGLLYSVDWSAQTTISLPGQDAFTNATERWTTFSAPTYFAAVSPGNEEDLVKTLRLATTHNIPFLATSGRHGFNAVLGELHNGLAIDLSNFDKLEIDSTSDTMTIGTAIHTADLLDPVYEAGYEIQGGTCVCPSFIGVTLGGGIGRWAGIYGLFIDALESVRFVAANGTILTASKTENSELFWGIGGAGANLGIITEATYNLHKITNNTKTGSNGYGLNADFVIPAEKNASYFELLERISPFPARLAIATVTLWNDTIGETQIISNWEYFGDEAEARAIIAPMIELGPTVTSIEYLPWNEIFYAQQFDTAMSSCTPGLKRDSYTASLRKITASTWQTSFGKMAAFLEEYPEARELTAFAVETWPNQASLAVPDEDTAFPWRDALGWLAFNLGWADDAAPSVAEAARKIGLELRADFAATSGYEDELEGGLATYVNYAYGDEPLEHIYRADKLPRLAALKKTWDPNNVFAYHLALPTEYPTPAS